MYPAIEIPAALRAAASRQDGVLTHAQAVSAVGRAAVRRMVEQRRWGHIVRGVYLTEGTRPTDAQRLWAGHLLGGSDSAIGGYGALFLSGVTAAPDQVEIWVPSGRNKAGRDGFSFLQDGAGRLEHRVGSLPRIRTEEALIDVGQRADIEGWVTLLADAAREGKVALPEVVRRIDARQRLAQRRLLKAVALDLQGIESTLEWVYREHIERAHGLPSGVRQVEVVDGWRCDVHYDPIPLIVEVDGRIHLRRVFRDLERDNDHALHGSSTLRYGSADLRGRPCAVAAQVGAALAMRGWTGQLTRCPRCARSTTGEEVNRRDR